LQNLFHIPKGIGTKLMRIPFGKNVNFLPVPMNVLGPSMELLVRMVALYVVDFHRGVIQHKRFLTSYLRRQSAERELDKHIGYGRIYRIVPEDQKSSAKPTESLVAGLSHPYLWWRLRSQKRIVEGDGQDLVVPTVKELARNRKASPFARVHAIWTLVGLKQIGCNIH
jgi:hypothetical protein